MIKLSPSFKGLVGNAQLEETRAFLYTSMQVCFLSLSIISFLARVSFYLYMQVYLSISIIISFLVGLFFYLLYLYMQVFYISCHAGFKWYVLISRFNKQMSLQYLRRPWEEIFDSYHNCSSTKAETIIFHRFWWWWWSYLIFVIFFTLAHFKTWKFYT